MLRHKLITCTVAFASMMAFGTAQARIVTNGTSIHGRIVTNGSFYNGASKLAVNGRAFNRAGDAASRVEILAITLPAR